MADFGEAYPLGAVSGSQNESAAAFHNQYPVEWQRLNREAIEEAGMSGEALFFSRSGAAQSPGQAGLFWLGDQLVVWDQHDGLKAAVTGMLSLGLSGFSLTHSDTGGYVTVEFPLVKTHRTKELFQRWCELSAFTSLYRTHPGTSPEKMWQFNSDNETLVHFAKFAAVYASLGEYRQQLMLEAQERGWPLVRPLFLHYPDDPMCFTLQLQYLLGTEFLIAPVTDEGASVLEVYLPEGRWTHVWTNKTFGYNGLSSRGGYVTVPAAIGQPGVFFQESSPQGLQFVQNLIRYGVLVQETAPLAAML